MSWMFNSDGTVSDYDSGATVNPNANEWWGASQPSSSDGGWDYGKDVLDILKFGAGVLLMRDQSEWQDQRRYEQAANGIALQGQAAAVQARATGLQASAMSGMLPMLLIGGAVVIAGILLLKD